MMITQIALGLVLIMFLANITNSTIGCPENYYGNDEGSPQDLLDRSWCDDSDSVFEP
jgi:hypothetical protein